MIPFTDAYNSALSIYLRHIPDWPDADTRDFRVKFVAAMRIYIATHGGDVDNYDDNPGNCIEHIRAAIRCGITEEELTGIAALLR